MENLELKILEEVEKLQSFAVKNPLNTSAFWGEWQQVFTRVRLAKIAIKKLKWSGLLTVQQKKEADIKLQTLDEIENYLKELKNIALQTRGFSIFSSADAQQSEDDESDDIDIDDLFL
ncbi:MAG: hypothetical protein GXN97_02680 [Aquificae bacterium]|jgi:hypothetical protein|nr:hypothetical protein [Aquificota bacterium]